MRGLTLDPSILALFDEIMQLPLHVSLLCPTIQSLGASISTHFQVTLSHEASSL